MMGLAKMSPEGWRYYSAEIAGGAEDYFLGHGEEPGRWTGAGAEALGLSGAVDEDELSRLFGEGRHPVTGVALGRPFGPGCDRERASSVVPVTGYALSFSPPKSVSILWALADRETSSAVRNAHDAAVEMALEFLQEHAAFTRRGRGGVVQVDTAGYMAAAFTHRTSRAGDPQLHTHVLVANKVRAKSDGHWLALDGRELYQVQKAAGLVYKAGLRAELSARLNVGWTPIDKDGGAEIRGVPGELIAMFFETPPAGRSPRQAADRSQRSRLRAFTHRGRAGCCVPVGRLPIPGRQRGWRLLHRRLAGPLAG
jgi:conjugative relaxase-like TrwC/TraI family protein